MVCIHNWSLQPFVRITTYLMLCYLLLLYVSDGIYSFKIFSEMLFMAIYFTLSVFFFFGQKSTERKPWKEIIFIFHFVENVWPSDWTRALYLRKPTNYLEEHCDFHLAYNLEKISDYQVPSASASKVIKMYVLGELEIQYILPITTDISAHILTR